MATKGSAQNEPFIKKNKVLINSILEKLGVEELPELPNFEIDPPKDKSPSPNEVPTQEQSSDTPKSNPSVKPDSCVNLLVNASFESPSMSKGNFRQYRNGIKGWKVENGQKIELQYNASGTAFHGNQLLELDSDKSATISQEITTSANQVYTLQFQFAGRPRSTKEHNILIVRWNGQQIARLQKAGAPNDNGSAVTNWELFEFEVTGIEGLSKLEFSDGGESNSIGTYLDDVKLFIACDE